MLPSGPVLLPIPRGWGRSTRNPPPDEAAGDRVVILGASRQRRQQHNRRSRALDNGLDDDATLANQHGRPIGMQNAGHSNTAMVSGAINRMGLTAPLHCQRSRSASARSAIISFFFILSRGGSSSGGMMPWVMLVGW